MSNRDLNLENLIQEYLSDEGILEKKLESSDFEFGFIISFPPGPKSQNMSCLLYTSPSPRDRQRSRMPSSA